MIAVFFDKFTYFLDKLGPRRRVTATFAPPGYALGRANDVLRANLYNLMITGRPSESGVINNNILFHPKNRHM